MDVITSVIAAAWSVTAIQLLFVTHARSKLVERMVRYGLKVEPLSSLSKVGYGVATTVALVAWLWVAIDGYVARQHLAELQQSCDEMSAEGHRCRQDLRNAAAAVAAVKRKIDHQSRADTVAITAVYHLDYTLDIGGDTEDMRFHTFCDEHADDVLWFSGVENPPAPLAVKKAKVMGYNGGPDKKGGFLMECRWSVMANRKEWCRKAYAPK